MGGAVFNHAGNLTLLNCTLYDNTANGGDASSSSGGGGGGSGYGGAIFNLNGAVSISFSTLATNSVSAGVGTGFGGSPTGGADGAAIYSLAYNAASSTGSATASLTLAGNILADSSGGNDLAVDQPGSVADGTANQATESVSASGTNLVTSDAKYNNAAALPTFPLGAAPLLAAMLAANGVANVPKTLALLPGSPAFGGAAVCNTAFGNPVGVDERGLMRPATRCDLGAVNDTLFGDGFE
jgi:hypothetical protein